MCSVKQPVKSPVVNIIIGISYDLLIRVKQMSLRTVNLNLLPILRSLLKTTSVSRSAAALHLSQPTVSDALSRLRALLNDELLVRIGSGMKLTQRATELLEPLDAVCTDLERLLHSSDFKPATVARDLVIATSDICAYMLVRRLLNFIRAEAPHMTLHVIEIDSNLRDKMAAGEIDFALLPEIAVEHLSPAPLRFAPLAKLTTSVLMSNRHPLAGRTSLAPEDLLPYPLIAFHPDPVLTDPKQFQIAKQWQGIDLRVEVRIGQMLLIPHLLIDSTSIAFVTDQLAHDMVATYPLVTHALPFEQSPMNIGLVWSPVYDGDLVHKWIRESLAAQASATIAGHFDS
jgi:LysR family transcriptional regulator, nod-box dependent transcriptional activator